MSIPEFPKYSEQISNSIEKCYICALILGPYSTKLSVPNKATTWLSNIKRKFASIPSQDSEKAKSTQGLIKQICSYMY
jgi:hypothetical protein